MLKQKTVSFWTFYIYKKKKTGKHFCCFKQLMLIIKLPSDPEVFLYLMERFSPSYQVFLNILLEIDYFKETHSSHLFNR